MNIFIYHIYSPPNAGVHPLAFSPSLNGVQHPIAGGSVEVAIASTLSAKLETAIEGVLQSLGRARRRRQFRGEVSMLRTMAGPRL